MTKFAAFGTICRIGNENLKAVTNVALVSGTTYRYTVTAHGYANGNLVSAFGIDPAGYNVTGVAISNQAANTFDLNVGSNPAAFAGPGWVQRADTFAAVVQVRNISGPQLSLDTADVTTHDSPGAWREFVGTLLDAGELTMELVFDPDSATHQAIRSDLENRRVRRNFQLVFPDTTATTWLIPAIVAGYAPDAPTDGELSAAVTIRSCGAPTLA